MGLVQVAILFLCSACSAAEVREKRMSRYDVLSNKNITTDVIVTVVDVSLVTCAVKCISSDNCHSLFYNSVIGECQLHADLFITPDGAIDQEGLQYYYIIKERNDWCPAHKDFQLLAEDGPCVKYNGDKKTWYEANQTCESISPHSRLLVIESRNESDLVRDAGKASPIRFTKGLWIGLSEHAQDDYRWNDGRAPVYTDWSNLDNSDLTQEDCVWINRAYGWHWRPMPCIQTGHSICQFVVDKEKYLAMMSQN